MISAQALGEVPGSGGRTLLTELSDIATGLTCRDVSPKVFTEQVAGILSMANDKASELAGHAMRRALDDLRALRRRAEAEAERLATQAYSGVPRLDARRGRISRRPRRAWPSGRS